MMLPALSVLYFLLLGFPTQTMGAISLSVVLRLGGVAYYMHQTPEVHSKPSLDLVATTLTQNIGRD
jgi:hypothetical protein